MKIRNLLVLTAGSALLLTVLWILFGAGSTHGSAQGSEPPIAAVQQPPPEPGPEPEPPLAQKPPPALEPPAAVADLPSWLLPVPGGEVHLGMTAEQVLAVMAQAAPLVPRDQLKVLRKLASTLGEAKVEVAPFLLATTPVTNAQYLVYVRETGAKFPFHWWRYGEQVHYESKLADINREFPNGDIAPLLYWERHYRELPYRLVDERGKPIDDLPVVFVSRRDAMQYAGWLGMRLPTEAEWTRAARGDGQHLWLWGREGHEDYETFCDAYSERVLEKLRIASYRDQHLRPAGALGAFATGPYGHQDMVGQVWEWIGDLGYRPLCGQDAYESELGKLQRDDLGARVQHLLWKDRHGILKGGGYFSWRDPEDFLIDARAPRPTDEIQAGAGFRLAKSPEPGRDMMLSLVGSSYNLAPFAPDQAPNLDDQIGVERYVLDPAGNPKAYHAVSFAPVNWMSDVKGLALRAMDETGHRRPLVIGTLAISIPLLEPALAPGIYTVSYRGRGMPKELETALREGYRSVQEALRRKERGLEPKADEEETEWRTVIGQYGIEERELEEKDAHNKIEFIRLEPNKYEISTEKDLFLFSNNDTHFVATMDTRMEVGADAGYAGASVKLDAIARGNERIIFTIGIPLARQDTGRRAFFTLPLILTTRPAASGHGWRRGRSGQ